MIFRINDKDDNKSGGKGNDDDGQDNKNGADDVYVLSDDDGADGGVSGQDGEVSRLKSEVEEQKKKYLYLMADFDNFRKNAIKERSDILKYGSEPLIREFLTVLDNLERAADHDVTGETLEQYRSGVQMIVSQFKKTLERFGVEEVEAKGQTFDPSLHEALSSVNDPDSPPNTVTQVFNKAYKLKGKVIRPAQVVVNTFKES